MSYVFCNKDGIQAEGRISDSTVTLAVPDPDGHRIGSGAATLNAILALANYYNKFEAV
ncbi:putative transferase [Helianthus anomalus]